MKKSLFLLLVTIGFAVATSAQAIKPAKAVKVQNETLRTVLTSVDTVIFRHGDIGVSLYKISNPSGSAHIPETDEVSNKYFIAIANGDEVPDINLYQVGDFYNPKVLKFELLGERCHIVIEYGAYKHRKKVDVVATLNNIAMKNI